ncbi:MAG: ATP-binding protein [Planctomycetota bacterium]
MFSGSIKAIVKSLRFQLTVWNTAAVLLTAMGALFGVREGLRRTLIGEVDSVLRGDLAEISLAIQDMYPDFKDLYEEFDRRAIGHVRQGWFVELLDEKGAVAWASQQSPALAFDQLPAPNQPRTIGTNRVLRSAFQRRGLPKLTIVVGTSLSAIEADMGQVNRMIALAGTVILFVAPFSGYLLAGRATRPLAQILQTTANLQPEHLSERLPIRGTGDELDQLSVTINGMLDRIATYLVRKRDFLANAAHELRSPLAAIRASVEVNLGGDRTTEEYQELLLVIQDECDALTTLVNQLLLLAEGDAGTLQYSGGTVRLDQLIAKSLEMFAGIAESQGVDLRAVHLAEATVLGEGSHFRQVVNNLVDNALKFTRKGGRVNVDLRIDRDAEKAVLQITDTGKGIRPEDLPFIFDRFFQADKARGREDLRRGSGLGLSICESIVHAYGGQIRVESKLGRGTTFTVTLPLHVARTPDAHASDNIVATSGS